MLKCDLCGFEAERQNLIAHAADELTRLLKRGFEKGRLETNAGAAKLVQNKEAFEANGQRKWNASFEDWLLCHTCSEKARTFKNMQRAAIVVGLLGLLSIGVFFVIGHSLLFLVVGVLCLCVAGGLAMRTTSEVTRKRTWEEELESLRNVKITPELIAFAQEELRKEVPNLLVQLNDERSDKRASAARILGNAGDPSNSVVNALIHALEDPDFQVQTNAAASLNDLRPDWTKSVNAEVMAPKLAAAIIDNKHTIDHETRFKVIDAIEKMDAARGEGLRILAQFEQGIDSAVKQSALGQSLGLDPQALDMKDKLTLLLGQMTQDTKQASEGTASPFKHITGKSLFYRCPSCNVLLRKRSVEGIADAVGTTSCNQCNASFPYGDVYYKGMYDVTEVEGACPSCAAVLRGPTDDLLGKPCPSCNTMLPSSAQ
ncbi:MAG: HEAT repeat domain-containing protein [Pyrinomonadaceae bacterium]